MLPIHLHRLRSENVELKLLRSCAIWPQSISPAVPHFSPSQTFDSRCTYLLSAEITVDELPQSHSEYHSPLQLPVREDGRPNTDTFPSPWLAWVALSASSGPLEIRGNLLGEFLGNLLFLQKMRQMQLIQLTLLSPFPALNSDAVAGAAPGILQPRGNEQGKCRDGAVEPLSLSRLLAMPENKSLLV